MKTIARNTTATQKVIDAYNEKGRVVLYPCYGNADLIYIDNGCEEMFTLDRTSSDRKNYDENKIVLRAGEMKLIDATYLEEIEISGEVEIDENLKREILDYAGLITSSNKISGINTPFNRTQRHDDIVRRSAAKFHKALGTSILKAEEMVNRLISSNNN